MKIKSKDIKKVSMNIIVPVDGNISIDENRIAEVSKECAEILLKSNNWEEVEEENPQTDRDILKKKVNDSKLDELKSMCEEAGFPKEEWGKMNKKALSEYILDKFDEGEEEEDDEEEK